MILVLCVGCLTTADAQTTFTQRLKKSQSGEGHVTVHHDTAIDELVNGKPEAQPAPSSSVKKESATTPKDKDTKTVVKPVQEQTLLPDTADHKKVAVGGVKVTGYRIQLFAGGNSRNDRLEAERIRSSVKAQLPGEPVYVHFYSPRWICRIGNYRTYEEAHEKLVLLRNMGYQQATIVKGKITVKY